MKFVLECRGYLMSRKLRTESRNFGTKSAGIKCHETVIYRHKNKQPVCSSVFKYFGHLEAIL